MWTMMILAMVVVLLVGSAGLAFAFGADEDHLEEGGAELPPLQPRPMVFFQPTGWTADGERRSIDEIVRRIEGHLREERNVVSAFAEQPSADRLHLD